MLSSAASMAEIVAARTLACIGDGHRGGCGSTAAAALAMLCPVAPDDLTAVTLHDPGHGLSAKILPGAGMLITSLQSHGHELLGQRRGIDAYLRDGKTMGVPLLYPWANRLGAETFEVGGVWWPARVALKRGTPVRT